MQGAHLFFHSPCLDGIVSGILTLDFLEAHQGWRLEHLHPVNYDRRGKWLSAVLPKPCAVVDFLYHPQTQFWADHHLTTFLSERAKRDFEKQKGPFCIYDNRFGSCAGLLWNHFKTAFSYRNERYLELVGQAEEIDAARYPSIEDAVLGDRPAYRINASLALTDNEEYSIRLVQALRSSTLDEVLDLPDVRARSDEARTLIRGGLERFAGAARLESGGIVVFDLDGAGVIVNRYAPYYFFPGARYSVGIVRSPNSAKITAMRNPWQEFPSVALGKIFERFGGGGHQRVASVILTGERSPEAGAVLRCIVDDIRLESSATTLQPASEVGVS